MEKRKINTLADEAAKNATPDDSSDSGDSDGEVVRMKVDENGNPIEIAGDEVVDERKFMKSMAR